MVEINKINIDVCADNYFRLRGDGEVVVGNDTRAPAVLLPVTHTFSYRRADRIFNRVSSESSGLYARTRQTEVVRTDGENSGASETGLFDYVFAYHGIHQSFYARNDSQGGILYPVGVFIQRALEDVTNDVLIQNATYRDLSVLHPEWEQWFLETERARDLIAIDIAKLHEGSFWKYWGSPDAPDFDSNSHWKHLFEFHFRDRVLAENFYGLIWPFRETFSSDRAKVRTPIFRQIYDFIRAEFQEIVFYPYIVPLAIEYNSIAKAFEKASYNAAVEIKESLLKPN
jgi:hypothetical protein